MFVLLKYELMSMCAGQRMVSCSILKPGARCTPIAQRLLVSDANVESSALVRPALPGTCSPYDPRSRFATHKFCWNFSSGKQFSTACQRGCCQHPSFFNSHDPSPRKSCAMKVANGGVVFDVTRLRSRIDRDEVAFDRTWVLD